MATRNQTALFRKYRDALRNVRPGSASTGVRGSIELTEVFGRPKGYTTLETEDDADPSRAGSVSVSLPPAWVDISDDVSSEMNKVKIKMADLAKSHGRALMVSFDDNTGEQHTIELLTAEITRSLKRCEQKLQRLSGGQGGSGDENLRKNVQRSLATDLQALSIEFRKLQKGYLARLRLQNEGQSGADLRMGFSQQRTREDDDELDDVGFSSTQMSQLKQNEAMSAEREREITQVFRASHSSCPSTILFFLIATHVSHNAHVVICRLSNQ
jgi:syntaxin 16